MQTSPKGYALIEGAESCVLDAYLCPAKVWTIGYGHTGPDVHPGLTITRERARELLEKDVAKFEETITRSAGKCTQGQFDALVSLVFNIGAANFLGSTLLRMHKAGNYKGAAEQFQRWNKARVKGVMMPLRGLTKRRLAEAALYAS